MTTFIPLQSSDQDADFSINPAQILYVKASPYGVESCILHMAGGEQVQVFGFMPDVVKSLTKPSDGLAPEGT
jgi:hypothetical protein